MIADMSQEAVQGEFREHVLQLFQGGPRRVLVTDIEIPYPDGRLIVSRTDTQGIITHVNQSFVAMSGYREEELIGAPHAILRHPDMPKAAFKDLWETIQQGGIWQGYVKNLRKDGAYYWVKATVIPNVRRGKIIGYSSVRRKPERSKVLECVQLYAAMRAKELEEDR